MRTALFQRDLWRAGCVERRTSGSGSGQGKPTGGNTGRASFTDFHQNFLTLPGSVGDMLVEARGFRLGLVLAHQDLAQLPKDVAAAVSANARSKIFFNVDPADARELSRHTLPELDEHDLTHLDAYTAASRLVVDGRQTPAFTMKTRPPKPVVGEATAIRQAAAAKVPARDTSAIDDLVDRFSSRPDDNRRARGGNGAKTKT